MCPAGEKPDRRVKFLGNWWFERGGVQHEYTRGTLIAIGRPAVGERQSVNDLQS